MVVTYYDVLDALARARRSEIYQLCFDGNSGCVHPDIDGAISQLAMALEKRRQAMNER
jgi:hypothetical protein